MPFNKKFRLLTTFLIILCLSLYPVAAAVPQQYDVFKDDKIDELDLGQVSQCIGSEVSGECSNCDVNGDGICDSTDYDLVYDFYQKNNGRGGESPEEEGLIVDYFGVTDDDLENIKNPCGISDKNSHLYQACRASRFCIEEGFKSGFQAQWDSDNTGIVYCIKGTDVKVYEGVSNANLEKKPGPGDCGGDNTEHNLCRAKRYCESLGLGYKTGFQTEWSSDGGGRINCLKGNDVQAFDVNEEELKKLPCSGNKYQILNCQADIYCQDNTFYITGTKPELDQVICLKNLDVCSIDSTPDPKGTDPEDKTSYSLFYNPTPGMQSNKVTMFFRDELEIDTEDFSKKLKQNYASSVQYDKNTVTFEPKNNFANPLIITKTGNSDIQVQASDGYIIQLDKKPVIEKRIETEEEIVDRKEEIKNIDTSGFKVLYNGPKKFFKKIKVNSMETNLDKNMIKHEKKIEKDQNRVKDQIIKEIEGSKPKITGLAVKSDVETEKGYTKTFNGFVLKEITEDEAQNVENLKNVKKVTPNYIKELFLYDSAEIIKADKLWAEGITGSGIEIAIIDTGIDYKHSDLGGCFGAGCKVVGGYDFVNDDNDPMDDHGHGTHVAATAAGNGELKGVAPDALLYGYKVCHAGGCPGDAILAAIERSVDPNQDGDTTDHVDIMSLSLGGGGNPDDPMSTAIDNAVNSGVVAVISAGNSGPREGTIGSPGTARKAITVGASCKPDQIGEHEVCNEEIASFSSRGPVEWEGGTLTKPDIVAPGVEICAALWGTAEEGKCHDDRHVAHSGTSMSAPHISGAAALLLKAHPEWSAEDVKAALMISAEDLGFDANTQGSGLADVESAKDVDFFISPMSISFGKIIDKLPGPQNITFINNGDKAKKLHLSVDCSVAKLSRKEVVLNPHSEELITLSLTNFPETDGNINGNVLIIDEEGKEISIPYSLSVFSEVKVVVKSNQKTSYSDIALGNNELTYFEPIFQVENSHTFYVPAGKYTAYAAGDVKDFTKVEYLLMESINVPKRSKVVVNLDIKKAKPFTIKAKSLDGTDLALYQWQKAYTAYNKEGCIIAYDFLDPQYGDRTVYVSKKPNNNLDVDVFFKYEGVPSKTKPDTKPAGGSRSFSVRLCE